MQLKPINDVVMFLKINEFNSIALIKFDGRTICIVNKCVTIDQNGNIKATCKEKKSVKGCNLYAF